MIIRLEGGLVQSVEYDGDNTIATIYDYDIDTAFPFELGKDDKNKDCFIRELVIE